MTGAGDAFWLPAAYRPVEIDLPDSAVLPSSSSLILSDRSTGGLVYTVTSDIRHPSVEELEKPSSADLDAMADYTQLPSGFPDRVRRLASGITQNAVTPYDKAVALEQYFHTSQFEYDTNADYSRSRSPLEDFLERKVGFCEQFAVAFAEMARSAQLPTRVAVGYQTLHADPSGTFHVTGADAHAWPEVWLGRDIGWYAFEPTKGRFNPQTQRGDLAAGGPTSSTPDTPTSRPTTSTTSPRTATTRAKPPDGSIQLTPPPTKSGGSGSHVLLGVVLAISAVIIAIIAALVALTLASTRRTNRRRHARDARRPCARRVDGSAGTTPRAAGVHPRPSATAIEFALRHAPAHGAGGAGPPLMNLARLQTAAMFAPEPPSEADATSAWRYVDAIDHALRDNVSRSERWVTRLRLRRSDRRNDRGSDARDRHNRGGESA